MGCLHRLGQSQWRRHSASAEDKHDCASTDAAIAYTPASCSEAEAKAKAKTKAEAKTETKTDEAEAESEIAKAETAKARWQAVERAVRAVSELVCCQSDLITSCFTRRTSKPSAPARQKSGSKSDERSSTNWATISEWMRTN
jgi:chemotaxis protein histidine kinase CheA